MKYITNAKYMEVNGKIWAINSRESGCYTGMLKRMISQMDMMLDHHNKILFYRFDLSTNIYTANNSKISEFNRHLFSFIKSEYQTNRIGFAWAREREKAKQQHYHYALFLDGNKISTHYRIERAIEEIWTDKLEAGRYWRPEKPSHVIRRGNQAEQKEAVYRISYLAKGRGKGYRDKQAKDYSTSRIKPPQNRAKTLAARGV